MKISYNWLKEHLPLDLEPQKLAEDLLKLGFEVTSIARRGAEFKGVVSGEILAITKHPNADRLSLCQVSDGSTTLSVVCGAKNIAVGQKVPLAKLGAVLPGGREIIRAKIRGVESEGMICSSSELGLGAESNGGIQVLDPATPLGQDLAQKFGPSDSILEVEISPNRPDCLSHLGLARELSAFLHIPLTAKPEAAPPAGDLADFPVAVEDVSACPRYIGRLFESLQIGPSPAWLAAKLESVGLRPINNLVDITNYILIDMGQPLHAFDADRLEGSRVVVRRAQTGEKIKALDGKEYALTPECLVVADGKKPAAIAGVMGGEESAVTAKTTRAFLESAHFAPAVVRKSSQLLRLRSDSSIRFERGTDAEAAAAASRQAANLIFSLCGKPRSSKSLDLYPDKKPAPTVILSSERINAILGTALSESAVETTLKAISAEMAKVGKQLTLTAPSHRLDLATAWDWAEEIARLLGYDNIPAKTPAVPLSPSQDCPSHAVAKNCRSRLAASGLMEAYNYDFLSEKLLAQARISENVEFPFARLLNPLNEDWTVLRPTLLIGLLQNAALNLNMGAASVRLFEIGKTYRRQGNEIFENARLAGLLWGSGSDFFHAKGIVADLIAAIPGLEWLRQEKNDPLFHPKASLQLRHAKGPLGTIGLLRPQLARAWGLEKEKTALFDLDLDLLAELPATKMHFTPFSPFPSSKRDLSFLASKEVSYAQIEAAIKNCRLEELTSLDLVDVFTGAGVPEGSRSLTVRLSFGRMDRTLKDAEVQAAVDKILSELSRRFSAVLRS